MNIFRVSELRFVNPDLFPNCLQTAPGTSRQRVNIYLVCIGYTLEVPQWGASNKSLNI